MNAGLPFVIWVEFDVKPGAFDKFHQASLEDAADSVRKEEGCLQFEVLVPTSNKDHIALFEVYKSKEAFLEHVHTPHCQKFLSVAAETTSDKHVTEYSLASGRPNSTKS